MAIILFHSATVGHSVKKKDGGVHPVTSVHPATCKSATAGQIGPLFSSSSS